MRNRHRSLTTASQFDSDTVAMTLAASVADTYFQILSLQQRIRLAKTIARDAARVLSLIEARQSVGTATEVDVAQQRNAVATFNAAVPLLQQQLEQNLHLLAVLVGVIPENFTIAAHSLDDIAVPRVQADLPSVGAASAARYQGGGGAARCRQFQCGRGAGGVLSKPQPDGRGRNCQPVAQPFLPGCERDCRISAERCCSRCFPVDSWKDSCSSAARRSSSSPPPIVRPSSLLCRTSRIRSARSRRSGNWNRQPAEAADAARSAARLAAVQFQFGTADFLTVLTIERTLYQSEDALLQVRLQQLQAAVGLFRALGGAFGAPQGGTVAVANRTIAAN